MDIAQIFCGWPVSQKDCRLKFMNKTVLNSPFHLHVLIVSKEIEVSKAYAMLGHIPLHLFMP